MPHHSQHLLYRVTLLAAALVALSGCATGEQAERRAAAQLAAVDQPVAIRGGFGYTNDIFLTYHRRHAVALIDLHGFVNRNQNWEVPSDSLVFGRLEIDHEQQSASYRIDLPLRPTAAINPVDHDDDGGVKLYAIAYWSDPFSDYDTMSGWPTYLSSLRTDAERKDEVVGGQLVVWSPDERQRFPSDFGADGSLFTSDDPLQPLPAGYSVIDLDQRPFAIDRAAEPLVTLYERFDIGTKDLSGHSYRHAFEQLFAQARREYAFNGIPGKEPDWDTLFRAVAPQVLEAERNADPQGFFLALRSFANGLRDGHSVISGGDLEDAANEAAFGGGYGFAIRELDDGRALVVDVLEDGPAADAGMREGAELRAFNGKPVSEAIAAITPPTGPFSTETAHRYDQARYLARAPLGTTADVTFANNGDDEQTARLEAVDERRSLRVTSIYRGSDPTAPPVEYWVLDSGLGYIRINSNDDDTELIDELFVRTLDSFEYHEVPGIIIDMRQNDGGTNLDLAGYLTDTAIPLAQLAYFSETTGRFETDGPAEEVEPLDNPYRFGAIAVLVGPACFSACEIEAYGFSKLEGAIVVGHYPTAGVAAEVARGAFELPEGISFQIPTGRFVNADSSLFLEGVGVVPTLRVPVDEVTVLSDEDEVLKAAETVLLDEAP